MDAISQVCRTVIHPLADLASAQHILSIVDTMAYLFIYQKLAENRTSHNVVSDSLFQKESDTQPKRIFRLRSITGET